MKDFDLKNFVKNVRTCAAKMLKCRRSAFTPLVNALRSELSPALHSQPQAHSSHTEFRCAHSSAFTLAEVTTVILVMLGIILLAGRLAIGDKQKEYNAKFSKISTNISSNISHDLVSKTGFEFEDYITAVRGNDDFQAAVMNNIDGAACNDCWSAGEEVEIGGKKYKNLNNLDNWNFYRLNDNSVMAVSKKNTDILVDVNGFKGPNMPDRDVRAYKYPAVNTRHGGDVIPGDGGDNPPDNPPVGPDDICPSTIAEGHIKDMGNFKYIFKRGKICDYVPFDCSDSFKNNKPVSGDGHATIVTKDYDVCEYEPKCPETGLRSGDPVKSGNSYRCPCSNSDESNHAVSNESTVTWTLSDECVWSCQNSRTNPGDNIQTYYEQKLNCDWDLITDCRANKLKVLTSDKKGCECKNQAASDHATSSDSTVTWTLSDECVWSCDNTEKSIDYNENTVARSATKDPTTCDYSYSYNCTSEHMNMYDDFSSDLHDASCDLDYTKEKNPGLSCKEQPNLIYSRQRSLTKGSDNKYTCKWTYDCNPNFTGKADNDTSDYNKTAVKRTKSSKHAYNYTGNENADNKVDNGKCDYTYTYQCQGGNGFQASWLDNYDSAIVGSSCDLSYTGSGNGSECTDLTNRKYTRLRELYKNGSTYSCKWNYGCNPNYADFTYDRPAYDSKTVYIWEEKNKQSVPRLGMNGANSSEIKNNIWNSIDNCPSNNTGTFATVSTGPCGHTYSLSCKSSCNAQIKWDIVSKRFTCDECSSGTDKVLRRSENPTLFATLDYCIKNNGQNGSGYRCGIHANRLDYGVSGLNYSNHTNNISGRDLTYIEFKTGLDNINHGAGGSDFFYRISNSSDNFTAYTWTTNPDSNEFKIYLNNATAIKEHVKQAYKVNKIFTDANNNVTAVCLTRRPITFSCDSPLSFDLDGNGLKTKDEIIEYDINGDGTLNKINDSADAVLCFDRDKDGICGKDGSELFGNNTRFGFEDENFEGYADGFDALKELARHEGLISDDNNELDENDIKYLEERWGLRIKKDGYLSKAEKLSDNKITSIKTSDNEKHWYENFDDKGNNLMVQEGSTFTIDNKVNVFADIWHKITEKIGDFIGGIANSISNLFGGGK